MQYDYTAAYLDFFSDSPKKAAQIVAKYADFPVPRWQKAFAAIKLQLDELNGKSTAVADAKDLQQTQTKLAATESSFHSSLMRRRSDSTTKTSSMSMSTST